MKVLKNANGKVLCSNQKPIQISDSGIETCTLTVSHPGGQGTTILFIDSDGVSHNENADGSYTMAKNAMIYVNSPSDWTLSPNLTPTSIDPHYYRISGDASMDYVCCFVAGTKILMDNDITKNIEDVASGDIVKSYDLINHTVHNVRVKRLVTHPNSVHMSNVVCADGTALSMTSYHPLLTTSGWHSVTNYNDYPTLVVGDELITDTGTVIITEIENYTADHILTYTLDVEGLAGEETADDNFFANNICAHNAGCPT